jgi:hypothetical protein
MEWSIVPHWLETRAKPGRNTEETQSLARLTRVVPTKDGTLRVNTGLVGVG